MACSCGNPVDYSTCCGPVISGATAAPTAERLMRARYSAYVRGEVDFLYESLAPSERAGFNREEAQQWSTLATWQGLDVLRTEAGGEHDERGVVEFVARYAMQGKDVEHREIATFTKLDGRWYFLDGETPKREPYRRPTPKVGLNEPCPCGSGKKFKKCCGRV